MKPLIALAGVVLVMGTASAQPDTSSSPSSRSDRLVVATDPTFPPMEYLTDQNSLAGFDVELMEAIAHRASLQIEFKPVSWEGIFSGLITRKYDAIISSVTIRPERQKVLGFSQSYINAGQALATRAEDRNVGSLEDLGDRPVGAQKETSGAEVAQGAPDANVVLFDDIDELFQALVDRKVDGVVVDLPVVAQFVANPKFQGRLRLATGPLNTEEYGIVFAKENRATIERVNQAIDELKADGELERLLEKWHLTPQD